MACLYCGKDVGPIQLLKGGDFCCASHRVSYHQRLSRALEQISRPEPPPPSAGFLETVAPCDTQFTSAAYKPSFSGSRWPLEKPPASQVSIRPVLGSEPRPVPRPAIQNRVCRSSAGRLEPRPFMIRPLLFAARPSAMLARAGAIPGPAAEAVEREVQPRSAAAPFAARTHSPEFRIELREPDPGLRPTAPIPHPEEELPVVAAALSHPIPEAVERPAQPWLAAALPAPAQSPGFKVLPEPEAGAPEPASAAMPRPTPEAAEREVQPRIAAALQAQASGPEFEVPPAEAATRIPAALPVAENWLPVPSAQTAEREVATREFAIPIAVRTVRIPELRIGITGAGLSNSGALPAAPDACDDRTKRIVPAVATAPRSPFLAPAALAAMPALGGDPAGYPSAGALRRHMSAEPAGRDMSPHAVPRILRAAAPLMPGLQIAPQASQLQAVGAMHTPLEPEESGALPIRSDDSAPRPVSLPQLDSAPIVDDHGALEPEEPENYPVADFLLLEYHPQRMRRTRIADLAWRGPAFAHSLPVFTLAIPRDEWTALSKPQAPRKPGTPAPVVVMPAPAPARKTSHWTRLRAAGAIAAALFAGLLTWGGAHAVRVTGAAVINRDASAPDGPDPARNSSPAGALASNSEKPADPPRGPMGWVKAAVASRAAMDLTDSFRGMEAWGMAPKKWAPGWSRHSDGYVRVGQFAIFNPSREYRNYRLEFLAQIENRGFNWAVRARDPQNYYAMKFTVLEAGLRPVIAMVHYPVVGGKAGQRAEIPLSVMIHRSEPYRVSVEVKGSRVVTSIEGQEVDSWNDRTLASGGIGFFSEPGERARLYWMKVAVNDDFMGRVCAYFSGAAASAPKTASTPSNPGGSSPGRPASPVAALAVLPVFANRRKQTWVC